MPDPLSWPDDLPRDVRLDPLPGDLLAVSGVLRLVVERGPDEVGWRDWLLGGATLWEPLSTWRLRMAGAQRVAAVSMAGPELADPVVPARAAPTTPPPEDPATTGVPAAPAPGAPVAAISLHVALNEVDPDAYAGWDGELFACHNDAASMRWLAEALGYQPRTLLDAAATRDGVREAVRAALDELAPGGTLLLSYSGHGGSLPAGGDEEFDGFDETLCLYDGQLLDDELAMLWVAAPADRRVVFVADSCHSGTVQCRSFSDPRFLVPLDVVASRRLLNDLRREIPRPTLVGAPLDVGLTRESLRALSTSRAVLRGATPAQPRRAPTRPAPASVLSRSALKSGLAALIERATPPAEVERGGEEPPRARVLPFEDGRRTEEQNRAFYDEIRASLPAVLPEPACPVLGLSACQDHELAAERGGHGLFTASLDATWAGGAFDGTYESFLQAISLGMGTIRQHPQLHARGPGAEALRALRPFALP